MPKTFHIFYALVAFAIFFNTSAQEKYLAFEDVKFNSVREQNTIRGVLDGESDLFDGFLVIAPEDSAKYTKWKAYYESEMAKLKVRKVPKKLEKDVKYIYNQLHEKFLRKYEYLAFYDQIFEQGVYNCVTAVALYALSFEELGIPYSIKETPTHVYIVVDPEESQLLIETTDPVSGFKSFSPGFKENFVAQLAMMKLVDQSDVNSKGLYPIFDEFYFGGADLTLEQLIGIQYYNKGLDLLDKKEYHKAWKELSKAQLFHSTDQLDGALFVSMINVLSGSDYTDWNDIKLLPFLTRFESFDVKNTNILGEFSRMISHVLSDRNESELAEKAYQYFIANSNNEKINTDVTFTYHYEVGRKSYNRANYAEAFDSIIKAYKAKPGNESAERLLTESFRLAHINKPTSETLATLDTLMNQNDELQTNNHLNTMLLNLYLMQMGEDFESRRAVNGNKMKEQFEEKIEGNDSFIYDKYILSNAYSKAAVYYFKRGYTSRARAIIQKGLEFVPDSYELKSRLRMISR
ncbi:hypothetical protein [Ekhidna sp. To15]|uniref:hypothetical protein n=1 Tax=Ekhidna sp. To15 TaxID=3395267 RepID=UPI003F52445D